MQRRCKILQKNIKKEKNNNQINSVIIEIIIKNGAYTIANPKKDRNGVSSKNQGSLVLIFMIIKTSGVQVMTNLFHILYVLMEYKNSFAI
jgi:hypothetical protein